jgi:hypothetical protein
MKSSNSWMRSGLVLAIGTVCKVLALSAGVGFSTRGEVCGQRSLSETNAEPLSLAMIGGLPSCARFKESLGP